MAMNKILLQGRLTKEPEIRLTSKNDKVAHFTIAVDRDFNREETDFINCVAFKATAAFIESYFGKGDMILVAGRLQMQTYTAKDGSNRTAAEVLTDNVWFCGGKGKTKDADTGAQLAPVEDDGQLPF
jgi:single-strand DNA-binding protein